MNRVEYAAARRVRLGASFGGLAPRYTGRLVLDHRRCHAQLLRRDKPDIIRVSVIMEQTVRTWLPPAVKLKA